MLDYGMIGNCLTSALIDKTGSIEWLCMPKFNSPSIFAKILDEKKGGSFEILDSEKYEIRQEYIKDTAILKTTFMDEEGEFIIYDFFPRYKELIKNKNKKLKERNELIRIITPTRGKPRLRLRYDPKPDYAREECVLQKKDKKIVCKGKEEFILRSNIDLEKILGSQEIILDETKYLVLGIDGTDDDYDAKKCNTLKTATERYWRGWVGTLVLPHTNKDLIIRSAITLKMLTYGETGAIVAAPTTSIPEEVGSNRTWDYRFCWLRDAALCVDALKKIGRDVEAKHLVDFVIGKVEEHDFLQIMYGIDGETKLTEQTLGHLEGFKGSKPVRIGNAAYNQVQHDIYGVIIDIIYLYYVYYEYENKLTKKYWRFVKFLVNQIKFTWTRPDSGIWEFRGMLRHYTYSKFMCYVGVDRAIKIAKHYGKDDVVKDWTELRDEIKEAIIQKGYNEDIGAFTMYFGGTELDASLLQMTYHEFLTNDDPKIIGTVKAIHDNLRHDYMVQRYNAADDFGWSRSSFTICSFWLVDALYMIGDEDRAREIFQKLIHHGNHVGLFSEDIDITTRQQIGNFPQAYTHISLINSAILLSEWSTKRKKVLNAEAPTQKRRSIRS